MSEFLTPQPGGTTTDITRTMPLYDGGQRTNTTTLANLPTIIEVLGEAIDLAVGDLDDLITWADQNSSNCSCHEAGACPDRCQRRIIGYLAEALPQFVGPYVTPACDESVVGPAHDALALAMYRGHIDWPAVADAVYWTAYVGESLDSLLGAARLAAARV